METTELAAPLCKIETLPSNKLSKASEAEREIAISTCCTRAAEETEQSCTAHHGANWGAAMGHESKANSICLSKRFGRLTPSAVKSSFNFSAFHITFCHEFYLSISEHSKPISVDNLSQKPSDCRQAFEVCRDQENQPPQKSSFLNIFSPD